MIIANMYEAKTRLSQLVQQALDGEEVILAKAGKPLVKLVPIDQKKKIKFGLMKGKIKIADDFNETSTELEEMFKEYLP
ncbi:MAG: type II toxin-antitoxin system Phd/YefM family antitoxin [SAR324 cluster bacterium]|nr:type II toxin-antitoxin system Phd/YefM family antitoxin [SAR324 cluster bacterium]